MNVPVLSLRAGEVVEVLSEEEIRATLDADGLLEGMPFMPEMWQHCGKPFRVFRRADKVCVEGTLLRHTKDAVFLEEVRCDGKDHDGCARMCLIFWKEAWLRRVEGNPLAVPSVVHPLCFDSPPLETLEKDKTYSCQSTCLRAATEPLSRWEIRQYIRDVTSGNFTVFQVLRTLFIVIYNRISRMRGGRDFGAAIGTLTRTPAVTLGLQPGEIVEVRTREEVTATVDGWGKNRGLTIDYEQLRHSGRHFRVLRRVDRMIIETTGKMREIQNTVLLDGAACEGLCRRACARNSHPMWREAWLKRVEEPARSNPYL